MINPNSSTTCFAYAEPSLSNAQAGQKFQFQRLGYFVVDNNTLSKIVFNKTVGLRDNWKK
jgi:glutaminyl-tRNA synthetase